MKEMMALPNVRMISPDVSTIDLINGSKGVFIINSTPGYEALVLGKPVVTFGHDLLFAGKEPVVTVHDMSKLPGVVMKLAKGGMKPDEKKAKELVARYYKHLIFLEGRFGMNRIDLTNADAKKMAGALEECIAAIA
jgi:capsule polysaccharide export protein KpsC/LpsZ